MKTKDPNDRYSEANYLQRMREKDEEEARIKKLVSDQNKREKIGSFVQVNATTAIFVPNSENADKRVQRFKNNLLERQNKW